MRILYFTPIPVLFENDNNIYYSGGWIKGLIEGIGDQGNTVGVAYIDGEKDNQYVDKNVSIYSIGQKVTLLKKYYNKIIHAIDIMDLDKKVIQIIDEFKPDLIYIFGTENQFGIPISKQKIPYVIHIQGILNVWVEKWFPNNLSTYDVIKANLLNFLTYRGLYHEFIKFKKKAIREKIIIKKCKHFIGRTDWDRRTIKSINTEAAYYHCHEMLRDNFYTDMRKESYCVENKLKLFSTSDSKIYKGIFTLLLSAHLLDTLEIDYKWNICGVLENDEIVKLYKMKTGNTISNNIKMLGKITPKDIVKNLLDCDIFVNTSHIENSCIAIQEAMITQVPIIATYAGGVPNIIENNIDGVLVQDGDPYSLIGAIIEISSDSSLLKRIAHSARKTSVTRNNKTDIILRNQSIYESIINLDDK